MCLSVIHSWFTTSLWLWLILVSEFRLKVFFSFLLQMKFVLSLFILVIILSLPFYILYLTVAWKEWFAILSLFTHFVSWTIFKFVSSHDSSDHVPRESSFCRKWADIIDSSVKACHWNCHLKILSRSHLVLIKIPKACLNTGQYFIIKKMRHFINVIFSDKSSGHLVVLFVLKSNIFLVNCWGKLKNNSKHLLYSNTAHRWPVRWRQYNGSFRTH